MKNYLCIILNHTTGKKYAYKVEASNIFTAESQCYADAAKYVHFLESDNMYLEVIQITLL